MAEERGVWLWLTLTKPYRRMGLASRMGRQPGHSFQAWLEPRAHAGRPDSDSGPDLNQPATVPTVLFSVFI
jgi:hypothetical protein